MPISEGSNKPLQSHLRSVRGLVLRKRITGGGVTLPRDECSLRSYSYSDLLLLFPLLDVMRRVMY
jgi:hypothetical protein